jgi:voltage-gated potassium channel
VTHRFRFVLAMVVAVIVLAPVLESEAHLEVGVMLDLVGLFVPVVAVIAASPRPRVRRTALVLAGISVLTNVAPLAHQPPPAYVGNTATLIFLALSTWVVLRTIVSSRHVTLDVVAGALASYILIGLTWAIAFGMLETKWPGSIRFPESGAAHFSDILYFSYVSLLTIGYGDISPVSHATRTLVVLEGLIGMAFTTVLLAVLVAKALHDQPPGGDA